MTLEKYEGKFLMDKDDFYWEQIIAVICSFDIKLMLEESVQITG